MIKVLDKVGVPVTNTGTGEKKCFPADVVAVFPPFAEIMLMGQRLSVALDTLTPWDDVPQELRSETGTLAHRPMLGDTLPKTAGEAVTQRLCQCGNNHVQPGHELCSECEWVDRNYPWLTAPQDWAMPTNDQAGQIVKTAARGEIVGDWWVMAAFVGSDQHDHMTAEPFKTKSDARKYLNLLRKTTKTDQIAESLPESFTTLPNGPVKARRYWIELEPDVQDEAAMIRETLGLPYHATVAQVLAKIAELRKRGD